MITEREKHLIERAWHIYIKAIDPKVRDRALKNYNKAIDRLANNGYSYKHNSK